MTELTVTRTLQTSPERLWRAFTSSAELAAWLWPPAWRAIADVDLRVGGRFRFSSEEKGIAVGGEYVAIEPITRIVTTWRWDGDEDETLVTYSFEPVPEGTRLTIVHERFTSADERDSHAQGWNDCLDRLPGHVG